MLQWFFLPSLYNGPSVVQQDGHEMVETQLHEDYIQRGSIIRSGNISVQYVSLFSLYAQE